VVGGSDVDFYDGEVLDTEDENEADFSLQLNQNHAPVVFEDGDHYEVLKMKFKEVSQESTSTISRINQLVDTKDTMTCYYRYGESGTDVSLNLVYYPEGRIKRYLKSAGFDQWGTTHVLTFLEVS